MTVPFSRLEGAGITPGARPVDRYVERRDNRASEVARALASLSEPMSRLYGDIKRARDEADYEEGQRFATEDSQAEAKLVRTGAIPAGRSKAFQRGAFQVYGQRLAMKYNMDFKVYADSKMDQAFTPEDIANLAREFDVDWREKNVPEELMKNSVFFDTFSKGINEGQYNTTYQQVVALENRKQKEAEENAEGLAYNLAADAMVSTLPDAERWERFDTEVTQLRAHLYGMGMRGETANRLVYEGVARAAVENGRPELAEQALEHTVNGADLPPAIQATLRIAAVDAARRKRGQLAEAQDQQEREVASIQNELADVMATADDPELVDVSAYVERIRRIDPKAVRQLLSFRDDLLLAKGISEASHTDAQVMEALKGTPSKAKTTLAFLQAEGHITRAQYRKFRDYAENVEADTKPGTNNKLRFSIISQYSSTLRKSLIGKGWDAEETNARLALYELAANEYVMGAQGITELEARKYLKDLSAEYTADTPPEPPETAVDAPAGSAPPLRN